MTSPIVRKLHQDGNCEIDFAVSADNAAFVEKNKYVRTVYKTLPTEEMIAKYDRYIDLDLVYERNPYMHAVDAYALHACGTTDFDRSLELFTSDEDKQTGKTFSDFMAGNYVVLHQRRWAWPSRNINPEMWAKVVQQIMEQTTAYIVQVGQAHEPVFSGHNRLIDVRGQFSIHELKEVIGNAKLFMGVDSAPSHIAAATNTDMLVLYTSVKEEYRRPLRTQGKFVPIAPDIDCYGCHAENPAPCTTFICKRQDVECVNKFNPDAIAEQAIKLINAQ